MLIKILGACVQQEQSCLEMDRQFEDDIEKRFQTRDNQAPQRDQIPQAVQSSLSHRPPLP